ncbi:MAG: alpha-1,4-glucan--maltose-1-phosphate maltosyltransferase [Deltaproteobacteria bacterium]|nr:alpha-1,4-glucan--maltose-1-phosphate maltosyltransferase [Deltaproteobacteria bacterium]
MNDTGPRITLEPPVEALTRRVWIENVRPAVDEGRYPIKRTPGEQVTVTADVFADGHDVVAAMLRYRPGASGEWQTTPMRFLGNDRWGGSFPITSLEPYHYSVVGWIDPFASWRVEVRKKAEVGQDVGSELLEGAALVAQAGERAGPVDRALLADRASLLGDPNRPAEVRLEAGLAPELQALMARFPDLARATEHPPLVVDVDPVRARFSAWYELFPRSTSPEPGRPGTFRDAERLLSYVARMGFDILYLPPIHPIGRTHRKGPNNTLVAGPEDPGSPWAIGAEEGGHTAVHPDLGTLEDFRRFLEAARSQGLQVALDLAYQCSPDHPWVREHPGWFRHRPDGTIKYAENPPKKYQDVFPLDFECREWRELWHALAEVVLFWMEQGVTVFRVDNPHTKPLRFWEWLIGQVRGARPDVIFLAEAFTRPTVLYALAKAGFNQSYTYFTWRNTRHEITEYLTELARSGVREFFRPNFFVNTPDILPEYLQFGGRPAFLARLVLAATLSSSYGVYSGFELCEAEALPGTEEYRDSEKFQFRPRDWNDPVSLADAIRRVNRIRRENPALADNVRLRFYSVDNEQILCYGKATPDYGNIVLVAVNLDPHHAHEGWLELPVGEFGIGESEAYQVHDLLGGGRYLWQGTRNYLRLDPASSPAQIFLLRRRVRSERDFDYFM